MRELKKNYKYWSLKTQLTWNSPETDLTKTSWGHFKQIHWGVPWSLFQQVEASPSNKNCLPSSLVLRLRTELTRHSELGIRDSGILINLLDIWIYLIKIRPILGTLRLFTVFQINSTRIPKQTTSLPPQHIYMVKNCENCQLAVAITNQFA